MTSHDFTLEETHVIPSLGIEYQRYQHPSGMVHMHLSCDDAHTACLLALRTTPHDNTGCPHILEHLTLCGSESYPVRDPFFMMLRRSMQTFMNAMTGSDMTWYPFATMNPQDFRNIFQVYSDAVFKPLLHPLDFAQEGHRLEYQKDGTWKRNGVVYNEMKGAMSETSAIMYQACCEAIMPQTPYQWNSGGDPSAIVDLSHQELLAFHRSFYNPANACIVTYGACDVSWIHNQLLQYCDIKAIPQDIIECVSTPPTSPTIHVAVPRTIEENDSTAQYEHSIHAYIWADSAIAENNILGDICEELLFGHAASPMRIALESSGLCHSTAGSGYCDDNRSGMFTIEAHGCQTKDFPAIQAIIKKTLTEIIQQGFSTDALHTAAHQIELEARYISGDHTPFGLELCEQCASAWNMDVDPVIHLDHDRAMKPLKERILCSEFWTQLIQERFIDNPQQTILHSQSDPEYFNNKNRDSEKKKDLYISQCSPNAIAALKQQQRDLESRHQQEDDENVLPRIRLADISGDRLWPHIPKNSAKPEDLQRPGYFMPAACNGIAHYSRMLRTDISPDSPQEIAALSLLTTLLGDCGNEQESYREISQYIQSCAGSLDVSLLAWNDRHSCQIVHYAIEMEMWGLQENLSQWVQFMNTYTKTVAFTECQRIRELLDECIQEKEETCIHSGHIFALHAASSSLPGTVSTFHHSHGIAYIQYLRALSALPDNQLSSTLGNYYQKLIGPIIQESLIGSIDSYTINNLNTDDRTDNENNTPNISNTTRAHQNLIHTGNHRIAFQSHIIASDVNYIGLVCSCPDLKITEAAALSVAARYMENKYLHTLIREQGGAYGASASFSHGYSRFCISTYRDPRLDGSIQDIYTSIKNTHSKSVAADDREQAIISMIAEIDKPRSPAGESKRAIFMDYSEWNQEYVSAFRTAILQVQEQDIQNICKKYIDIDCCNIAVLGNAASIQDSQYPWQTMSS